MLGAYQSDPVLELVTKADKIQRQLDAGWYEATQVAISFPKLVQNLKETERQFRAIPVRYDIFHDDFIKVKVDKVRELLDRQDDEGESFHCLAYFLCLGKPVFSRQLNLAIVDLTLAIHITAECLRDVDKKEQRLKAFRASPLTFVEDRKYVPFMATVEKVRKALENEGTGEIVILCGESGSGKTSLAKYVSLLYSGGLGTESRHPKPFRDGVIFLNCGLEADREEMLMELCQYLDADETVLIYPDRGSSQYSRIMDLHMRVMKRLEDKNVLIVMDDVCDTALVVDLPYTHLLYGETNVKYLVTTTKTCRDNWPMSYCIVDVDKPSLKEALQILTNHCQDFTGAVHSKFAELIIQMCDSNPSMMAAVASAIKRDGGIKNSVEQQTLAENPQLLIERSSIGGPILYGRLYSLKRIGNGRQPIVEPPVEGVIGKADSRPLEQSITFHSQKDSEEDPWTSADRSPVEEMIRMKDSSSLQPQIKLGLEKDPKSYSRSEPPSSTWEPHPVEGMIGKIGSSPLEETNISDSNEDSEEDRWRSDRHFEIPAEYDPWKSAVRSPMEEMIGKSDSNSLQPQITLNLEKNTNPDSRSQDEVEAISPSSTREPTVEEIIGKADFGHLQPSTTTYSKKDLEEDRGLSAVRDPGEGTIGKDDSNSLQEHGVNEIPRTKSVTFPWTKGEILGAGLFGTVYEAVDSDGMVFAVKERSLLGQDRQARQSVSMLMQEVELLSRFKHDNIVRYLGTDRTDDRLYVFLEFVGKGSLASICKRISLSDSQISAYTRQILKGLKYLHDQNVVHRDIKCANILVDTNGICKLADFGMAKQLSSIEQGKSTRGSFDWMAPEVIDPKKTYGNPADIWSLGCSVLEMSTGTPPFGDMDWYQVLWTVGDGNAPPIPDSLSERAKDFVKHCLEVNPIKRPTATELLDHPFVRQSSGMAVINASVRDWLKVEVPR